MKKEVVIVTGSCGRIGTAVIKRLAEKYCIVGFDLSTCGEFAQVDLSSDESVRQAFVRIRDLYGGRISSVIHLAAYYSFAEKDSPQYDRVTVKGTERLLDQLKNFEVGQFLFTSTMLVHKPTQPGSPITEDAPLCGTWGYPVSKIKTEELIHEKRGKMPVVILRIAGVYDDQCHSIPIGHQIQRIYEKKLEARFFPGDLTHGAAFVHMEDVVEAIALAVEKRRELPEEATFLIGEPKTLSYDEMQKSISKLLFHKEIRTFRIPKWIARMGAWVQGFFSFKEKPFIKPWMIDIADDHYELDIRKAKELLGFYPKHSVEKTLPIMIESLKFRGLLP